MPRKGEKKQSGKKLLLFLWIAKSPLALTFARGEATIDTDVFWAETGFSRAARALERTSKHGHVSSLFAGQVIKLPQGLLGFTHSDRRNLGASIL